MKAFDQWKLLGPVRACRTEWAEWDATAGGWQLPRRWIQVQFLPNGEITKREDHNPDGSVSHVTNVFAQNGLLLESGFQMDAGPISRTIHRYDNAGRLTQTLAVDGDGVERQSEICSYDDQGRKTRILFVPNIEGASCGTSACGTFYGVDGSEQGYGAEGVTTITTLYDDHGKPYEAQFRDQSDAVILRVLFTRDAAQRLVKEESQSGDHPPFAVDRAIENASPDEREATASLLAQLFGTHKAMYTTLYSYDDRGRQVERHQLTLGDLSQSRRTIEFDERDNPILEIEEHLSRDLRTDESGKLQPVDRKSSRREVRYEYKYDSRGNWTERLVSFRSANGPDFQRSNVERREILYYA
jgi:hypothetical protein